ncbi:MAG: TrkH family potassium uptake protein [Chitinophagales bacterium]
MKLNWKIITSFLGMLLILNGTFMVLATLPGFIMGGGVQSMFLAGGGSIFLGVLLRLMSRGFDKNIGKREGYLIVSLGWLVMTLSGCLPYFLSGVIPSLPSAIFESVSGYTTTGASVLNDIEAAPHAILMWRSITHWIGGMGIIVLTVAILPILGIGGMQLFTAEAPGVSADKLHPRITGTAKRLWFIYVGITVVEMFLLKIAGMTWFDALNHAMSTVSTGGFSTKNASIAAYQSPLIQYIIIAFMFISGINFSLVYWGIKGKLNKIWKNEEFRFYLIIVFVFTLICTAIVFFSTPSGVEKSFRDSLFQVVAFITTTGFVTADLTNIQGAFILKIIFFLLMFMGGSAGSTAGGIKMVRHLVIFKNSFLEFKRLLHPNAIIPVRYNGRAIKDKITHNIMAFLIMYFGIFAIGSLVMSLTGLDFETALSSAATSLGNVGPGLGQVCPTCNFSGISSFGKLFLSFLMLIGRLEIFTVLILFSPFFWRKS